MSVLITILAGLIDGQSIGAVLGGLTIDEWLTLAASAAEALAPELASLLGLQSTGNTLGSLIDGAAKVAADDAVRAGVKNWMIANSNEAIKLQPGISTDS